MIYVDLCTLVFYIIAVECRLCLSEPVAQFRQWPEVPDSALPARTLATLEQQPSPSQILGEEECEIG